MLSFVKLNKKIVKIFGVAENVFWVDLKSALFHWLVG